MKLKNLSTKTLIIEQKYFVLYLKSTDDFIGKVEFLYNVRKFKGIDVVSYISNIAPSIKYNLHECLLRH